MTVFDFVQVSKGYPKEIEEDILKNNDVFSVAAVKGYLCAAMDMVELEPSVASRLQSAFDAALDNMTVEEAHQYFYYGDY